MAREKIFEETRKVNFPDLKKAGKLQKAPSSPNWDMRKSHTRTRDSLLMNIRHGEHSKKLQRERTDHLGKKKNSKIGFLSDNNGSKKSRIIFCALQEDNAPSRISYPDKLLFKSKTMINTSSSLSATQRPTLKAGSEEVRKEIPKLRNTGNKGDAKFR